MLFSPEMLKLLSTVLDDVCSHVSDGEARTYVATRLLEAAGDGERSPEIFRQVATLALLDVYSRTWVDDAAVDDAARAGDAMTAAAPRQRSV